MSQGQALKNSKPAHLPGHSKDNLVYLDPPGSNNNTTNTNRKIEDFVRFDRSELNQLLRVYGFKVASGEWRDYAIDMLKDRAVFSVYRRSSEVALYSIEKKPKLTRKQGAYAIISASGQVLKRGHDLAIALRLFDKQPRLVR